MKKQVNAPKMCLNVFEGFNPDIYGPEISNESVLDKLITPYMDLVQELCGGDDDSFDVSAQMGRSNVSRPTTQTTCCDYHQGQTREQGRTCFLDAIGNMLNKTHYITSI